jgi:mxaA protein
MSLAAGLARVAVLIAASIAANTSLAAQHPSPAGERASATPAVVDQPRPFGYVVGDVITQRVLLTTPGEDFEPTALPAAQRLNIWFERRASRIERASDQRRWLVVDYQLINAPQTLTTIQLPAWKLEGKANGAQLTIPAAPISVAPLLSNATAAAGELRPDRELPIVATAPAQARVFTWAIALLAVSAAWLAWLQWRNWRDSLNQPFARALRELRRFDDTSPEAWQALHRAFDQTAGRVLQIQTLPTLFECAPHLQPRRAEIERFFTESSERFFGTGLRSDVLSVRALCNELRRIERRHAQ